MKKASAVAVAFGVALVSLGCSAAGKGGGSFVLIDGQRTRLPMLTCRIPDGCVALGKVSWTGRNPADPLRYHVQAVGIEDGAISTVSGGFLVERRNVVAMPAQSPEVSDPNRLAQWVSGEICGVYGLKNVQVLSAEAIDLNAERSRAYADAIVVGARAAGLNFTTHWVKLMHFRYGGMTKAGKLVAVDAVFPYLYFVNGGRFANGMALELSTTCAVAADEKIAQERLLVMASSRVINLAFSKKFDEIVRGAAANWIKSNNQMVSEMMRINRDLENAYASCRDASWYSSEVRSGAVDRFCDAIRGEAKVTNPATGRECYISTDYDHCAVNAFGDQLYWNGSGATANFDPNANANFNGVHWGTVR